MSDKCYITAQQLLEDSFRVAAQVYQDGFRPDFIIGIWRGGAPIGIAVQEYYDYKGIETDHIAVRTSSYYGIGKQSKEIKRVKNKNLITGAAVGTTDEDVVRAKSILEAGADLIVIDTAHGHSKKVIEILK